MSNPVVEYSGGAFVPVTSVVDARGSDRKESTSNAAGKEVDGNVRGVRPTGEGDTPEPGDGSGESILKSSGPDLCGLSRVAGTSGKACGCGFGELIP